jgi:site-specific recombinase XerD
MHALQISLPTQNSDLKALVAEATEFLDAAKAKSTRRAYESDVRSFRAFCTQNSLPFLPSTPTAVALYIARLAATLSVSTIKRRMAAITDLHAGAGFADSPATPRKHYVVRDVLAGIKRLRGAAPRGADPILGDAIRRITAACPATMLGLRDRALVLLGFAAGSRRSELASIFEVRDLTFTEQGVYILIRHSKADPLGADPRTIAIPFGEHSETCPILALRRWLEAAKLKSGAIFRAVDRHGNVSRTPLCPRSIAKILKRSVERAGMDPQNVSPHGLRAGMATTAAIDGASEREIARITGHRSSVVRRYIRDADLFRNNASARLGL